MAKQDEKLDIKEGLAENIPYNENFFDFLTADQVVEHLFDPNRIFAEAKRILKREGLFCISVPDAMMYDDNYFFDFYWFLIREHIQHFDSIHLELLAKKHGFELIKVSTTFTPMISNKTILPNMSLLFKLTQTTPKNSYEDNNHFRLREETKNYIQHCYSELNQKRIIINNILKHNKPIYIFGVSREFLYLYNNTNLYKCNILELIDDTPNKQKFYTVKGRKIIGRAILKDSTNCVLITAFAHTAKIIEVLKSLNFKGEILEI
jgi:SAM-dependent methyltransferase